MKPSMPFFDFVTRVPLRDLEGAGGNTSTGGRGSAGSTGSGGDAGMGAERRLESMVVVGWEGKRSLRVAVLAREGRGGGEVVIGGAAKGSWEESFRARGFGFWRELRTFGGLEVAMLASLRRSEYSWMDSREGRWYSTVIFDCR